MDQQDEIPKHKKKATPGHIIIEYRLNQQTRQDGGQRKLWFNWCKDWTKWKAYKRQQDAEKALKSMSNSDLFEYRLRPAEKGIT